MKISDTALDLLANTVTGSNKKSFHRGGAQLKQLFDQFGFHDDVVMTSRLEYTKARLQELNGTKKLKKVIEAVVDPRKFLYLGEKYLEGTVAYLNTFLVFDGYKIVKDGLYYTVQPITDPTSNPLHPIKNIIFAANGPKPEIVLEDAIANDIRITKNEQYCLVYDEKIPDYGLLWWELIEWWVKKNNLQNLSELDQSRDLYRRLALSLGSEPEKNLFKAYFDNMHKKYDVNLPALIPQVYLHYDPYTVERLAGGKRLIRQRMDFLLLLPSSRIILEVDGIQHYSQDGQAKPSLYAELVAEDRRLKLSGYEVFRFGGYELYSYDNAKNVTSIFF
jgi:hypothetical protein